MPIDHTMLRGFFQQTIGQLPIDITFDSVVYSGTKASRKDEIELRVAGLLEEDEFSVYLDLDALHATPEVKQKVTIGGVNFRIMEIGKDPADVYIRLDLSSEFAGRL